MTRDAIVAAIASLQALLPDADPTKVCEVVARYQESVEFKKLKARVDEARRYRLHVLPLLGDDTVASLTNERLAWYRGEREKETGNGGEPTRPATRNREVRALSGALSWAVESKIIAANPILGAPMEEEDNVRETCPGVADVNRIALAARSIRLRAMVLAKFFSGMRVSELLAVDTDQVEWDEGLVVLKARQTKGGKRKRTTILPEQASRLIRDYFDERVAQGLRSPMLFCTDSGKRISRRNFLRDFQAVAERAGVGGANGETLCLHDLRSGFVGRQIELGTQQEVIKSMLGQTTDSAFRRYVRIQRKWLIDARERTELAGLSAETRRPPRRASKATYVESRNAMKARAT